MVQLQVLPPLLVQVEVVKVEVPQPLGSFCTLWPRFPWGQKFYCQLPVKLKIEVEELSETVYSETNNYYQGKWNTKTKINDNKNVIN